MAQTAYDTDIKMLGMDSRSSFFLIDGDRFRVAYSSGGMYGYDVVYLWMPGQGWTEVAKYSISRENRDGSDKHNGRVRAALTAHDVLRSV